MTATPVSLPPPPYRGAYVATTLDDLDRELEHQVLETLAENQERWGVWDGTAATFAPPPPGWDA